MYVQDAPVDHIMASVTAFNIFYILPLGIPLFHRYGRGVMVTALVILLTLSAVGVSYFASKSPFDAMHQRRLFAMHVENITSNTFHLRIAAADAAPGLQTLVERIAEDFSLSAQNIEPHHMDDHNPDWDIVYPFSQFLTPFGLDLPHPEGYASPWLSTDKFKVSVENDLLDTDAGTRSMTLVIDHPGIIWTVIAFDAHVLAWGLDDKPPTEYTRHHVKEASFYGVDRWTLHLVTKVTPGTPEESQLKVNFMGILEKGMWPGKIAEREGPAMDLFENLSQWFETETGGSVDALMVGCVAGVVVL